ncbi:ABC transporter substrate-binding protein [Tistrella bauzanensis]|uniref:ABC transporter substrate-binding protein n=1 Tax=Tistrella arctica TaxID=3133430 RepID=A0ABU9YKI2_9PROT
MTSLTRLRSLRGTRVAASLAALAIAGLAAGSGVAAETKSVAITQIVEHPALDATRQGVQDALKAAGWEVGKNLEWDYQNAQGNVATAGQIARKFVGDGPDAIVAIATPSAQAVAAATRDIPLVFSAVTDPVGAKLISNMEKPGGNVTGVSDLSPMGKHLELITRITPNAKRLGVIYNPGEANAVALVDLIEKTAGDYGMTVSKAAATKSSDVLTAARSLVGKVDVIYVPTDNTVVSAIESVVKVGQDADIPVYAGDTNSVGRGAIAAVGFNYYDVGYQTGEMVARILGGANPGDIPASTVEKLELYLNPGSAKEMGVTIPEAVIADAKEVVK